MDAPALRTLAAEPDDAPAPAMSSSERVSLQAYVERFNAHDFDAIRDMLAEEVRLDLVARTRMNGKREVATYFHNYSGSRTGSSPRGWSRDIRRSWSSTRASPTGRSSTSCCSDGVEGGW